MAPGAEALPIEPIPLAEIEAARERLKGSIMRTPLVRLGVEDAPAEVYLKLENLQPMGSFKVRGAGNAMALADPGQVAEGLWTASAGNMAQAVAWHARRLGVPCTVVVPDTAASTKVDAVRRLGASIEEVPFGEWFELFRTRRRDGLTGLFVHPFSDAAVMAGNGTIGLEILEELPDVDAVLIPFGGGGLSCGIASALRALKPKVRIYAAEVTTGAPLAASLADGRPVEVPFTPSFVDGAGGPVVLPEMFAVASKLFDGSLVVEPAEVAQAVRIMAERNRVIAEGAGALPVAAALQGLAGGGNVVCVVSGGNIDSAKLSTILGGDVP
ncbi:MAG TPA: threonine/serine dehydratase [Actinomycetota bacterium]|jgi:threonine dehydratase|nr:threonine/serine dehydratase [Actinomycetota bacterium]